MENKPTLYEILGVSRSASRWELEEQYVKLRKNIKASIAKESAQRDLEVIKDAFNVLSNPDKRSAYDKQLYENEPDFYEIIRVGRTASQQDVEDQYVQRRQALLELLQTFPEKKEQISKELEALEEAFEILGNSEKRAAHYKRGRLIQWEKEKKTGRLISYVIGALLAWASAVFLYQWVTLGYEGAKRVNKLGPLSLPFAAFWIWIWFLAHFQAKGDKDGEKFVFRVGIIVLIVTMILIVAPRPSVSDCEVGRAGYVCR
jgi:curved DNA-binding protein CbpA